MCSVTWNNLNKVCLMSIIRELGMTHIWRVCSTEKRVREIYKNKGWRISYLQYRGTKEVQLIMNFSVTGESVYFGYYKEWLDAALYSGMYDPGYLNNIAVRKVIQRGCLETMKILLADSRVDSSQDGNAVLNIAMRKKDPSILMELLKDPRVDPSNDGNTLIKVASANGWVDIVKLILQDSRVDPQVQDNAAIRLALENGHVEVVQLLKMWYDNQE